MQYLPLSSYRQSQMPPCFPGENPYTVWVNFAKVASLICESDPGAPRRGDLDLEPASEGPAAHSDDFALCREIIPADRGDRGDTSASADGSCRVPSQTVAMCARRRLRCERELCRCLLIQKPPRLRCPVEKNSFAMGVRPIPVGEKQEAS